MHIWVFPRAKPDIKSGAVRGVSVGGGESVCVDVIIDRFDVANPIGIMNVPLVKADLYAAIPGGKKT